MKHSDSFQPIVRLRRALTVSAALGLLAAAPLAWADDPVTMAPPIQPSISQSNDGATFDVSQNSTDTSQDSVFNWTEVPQGQRVPLTRAVFDKGGYQLYDTQGETIIVPFANQNLYVMKFGLSDDGTTYFENEGTVPVLYIPKDGSLENASAPGTRWYPFPKEFHYEQPVFLGVAPSYPEFVDMGWYPGMVCYGGYYSHTSFISGGIFLPTIGLSFFIGGHPYYGWHGYHDYYYDHPAPYHVTIVNNNFYHNHYSHNDDNHFGGRPGFGGRPFMGTGHPTFANHSFGGSRTFGDNHSFGDNHTFGGGRTFGGNRTFGGGTPGHTYWAHRTFQGTRGFSGNVRSFQGGQPGVSGTTHTFQGTRSSSSFGSGDRNFGNSSRPDGSSFGGGERTFGGGRSVNTGNRAFGGESHTFSGGGRSSGEGQSFPAAHSNGGGGRSFGGGQSFGGGRSSNGGGGGRSFNGGGGGSSNGGGGRQFNGGGNNHR